MESRRSLSPQEVPHDFAVLLRRLRDEDRSAVLNALLAASREHGWRTPSLALALEMNPPAVSKRIERARRATRNQEPGWDQVAKVVEQIEVPDAPRVQATIDGKRLPQEKIDELLEMQRVAAKVNGAMAADREERLKSEQLAAELNRLITQEGFTPYYLARVLGRSHRAITSRLERHHYRDPCPSVAGTPSGEYRRRKIGDPLDGGHRGSALAAQEYLVPLPGPMVEDLGLSLRTTDSLLRVGKTTIASLLSCTAAELLELPGVGEVAVEELQRKLAERDLRLRADADATVG